MYCLNYKQDSLIKIHTVWVTNRTFNRTGRLTLFYMWGGHYGPDDRRSSVVSLWIALRLPNFFTLFLSMFYKSQKSHFQKKKKFREKYRTLSKISIYDMQAISFLLAWVWLRPQNANVRGKNTTLNCQKQSC